MGYYTTYSLEIEDPDETLTLEDVLLFMAPTAKPLRIWVGTQVGRIIIRPVKDGTGLGRKYALHLKEFDNVDCRSTGITRDGLLALAKHINDNLAYSYDELRQNSEYNHYFNVLTHGESTKWYDYKDTMILASRNWPKVLFKLKREGADNDDRTLELFRGGKHQTVVAKITFDEPLEV